MCYLTHFDISNLSDLAETRETEKGGGQASIQSRFYPVEVYVYYIYHDYVAPLNVFSYIYYILTYI